VHVVLRLRGGGTGGSEATGFSFSSLSKGDLACVTFAGKDSNPAHLIRDGLNLTGQCVNRECPNASQRCGLVNVQLGFGTFDIRVEQARATCCGCKAALTRVVGMRLTGTRYMWAGGDATSRETLTRSGEVPDDKCLRFDGGPPGDSADLRTWSSLFVTTRPLRSTETGPAVVLKARAQDAVRDGHDGFEHALAEAFETMGVTMMHLVRGKGAGRR
jgi:hypothetical protein